MIVGMGALDPNQLIPDRDELRASTDALKSEMRQLAKDWFDDPASDINQGDLTMWNAFVAEVNAWDDGPDFFIHPFTRTWLTQLADYERRYNAFLAMFQNRGVDTHLQPFTFADRPGVVDKIVTGVEGVASSAVAAPGKALNTLTTAAIVGGVVVTGLVVYAIWESGRTIRHTGAKLL